MTTVINTPPSTDTGSNSAGWVVAVIILLAVIAGGAYLWMHHRGTSGATNINVTLPSAPSALASPRSPTY